MKKRVSSLRDAANTNSSNESSSDQETKLFFGEECMFSTIPGHEDLRKVIRLYLQNNMESLCGEHKEVELDENVHIVSQTSERIVFHVRANIGEKIQKTLSCLAHFYPNKGQYRFFMHEGKVNISVLDE